jgi:hypothetical protein
MRRLVTLATLVAAALFPPLAPPAYGNHIAAQPLELCVNGGFENLLGGEWQVTLPDSASTFVRGTECEPDPDYEGCLLKTDLSGTARVDQLLPLPGIDTQFSVKVRLWSESGSVSWAAAAVIVGFVDEGGLTLGETAICNFTRWCPWESRPDFHVIEVGAGVWETHTLDVAAELATYLPAVDPTAVHSLRLSLSTTMDDC